MSVQWRLKSLGIVMYLGEIGSEGVKDTGWSAIVHVMTSDTEVNVMTSDTKGSYAVVEPELIHWLWFPMFTRLIMEPEQSRSLLRPLSPLKMSNHLDTFIHTVCPTCLSWAQDTEVKLLFPSWHCMGGADITSTHGSVRHTSQGRLCLDVLEMC